MEKAKISGIVLTKNNQETIQKCVSSLKNIVEELIIIDDFSDDKTISKIKPIYPNFRLYKRHLNNDFSNQRNFALSKAKNDWVIMIDSDEELSEKLKKEIINVLEKPKYSQYTSRRDNIVLRKSMPSASGRPILLKKNLKFYGKLHENTKGKKGYLKSILYHHINFNIERFMKKMNFYSLIDAQKWIEEKRNYNKFQILLISIFMPLYKFVLDYIYSGYYKYGLFGFLFSINASSIWKMKAFKYYEIRFIRKK